MSVKIIIRLTALAMCFYSSFHSSIVYASSTTSHDDNNGAYIGTNNWQVSLAIGYGVKSNPLAGGDALPLVILPDIAYYQEQFYFDNGDIGYTLFDEIDYSFSLLTRLNIEKAYFSRVHPVNIFSPEFNFDSNVGNGEVDSGEENNLPSISIDDIDKRKYAVDAGGQLAVYLTDATTLKFEWLADISNVYQG